MIPAIGIMIGAYVITKMLSFITRKGDRSESTLVKIVAILTILITLFIIMDLLAGGLTK